MIHVFRVMLLVVVFPALTNAQVADERNTLRLAQVYEQAGKHDEALRYYRDLFAAKPDNSAYFEGVRRCLLALKQYTEAVSLLGERIRRFPADEQLLVHRGGVYVLMEKVDSARADWKKAIALNPKNGQTYGLIADHCLNARLYPLAVEYLREGREELRAPQMFTFEIARACAMNMDFDGAMDEYLEYLRAVPQSLYQIQQQIAMFSEVIDGIESALRRTQAAVKRHSDDVSLQYLLSWLYQERKQYSEAFAVVREVDRLKNAGGMEVLRFAGRAFDDGAFRVAADAYRWIIEKYEKAQFLPQAEYHYARCMEALQEQQGVPAELDAQGSTASGSEAMPAYRGVISLYEDIVRKHTSHPMASESQYRIGYITYHWFGDTDGALRALQGIAGNRAAVFGKADADILIGDIHVARGDLEAAITQYDAVLLSPQLDEKGRNGVRFRIAEVHFFQGRFDTALSELQPLTEDVGTDIANDALELSAMIHQYRSPGEVPLQRYAQALFLERQRKLSEADALLQQIIGEYASSEVVDLCYLSRAAVLERMGRYAAAAAVYAEFLAQRGESFLRDRGLFLQAELTEVQLNDAAGAMVLYQRLLDEYPNSPYVPQARDSIVRLRKGNS